jgi:transcriptional regulator with XRE-family HTH domain
MKVKSDVFPLLMIARCMEACGGKIAKFAAATDVSVSTIYTWLKMHHAPSPDKLEKMQEYLASVNATPPPPVVDEPFMKREYRTSEPVQREELIEKAVYVTRHSIARNGERIIFGETLEGDAVFIPPSPTRQVFAKYGSDGVVPVDTRVDMRMYRDASGRSGFIALEVAR